MANKMKALVKSKAQKGIWMEEVDIPEPGMNDVIIKVKKTAICGTDIHIYNWDTWAQKHIRTPIIVGHEFVGVVEKVGSNVPDFKPGDLVSGEGHVVCGLCRNCMAGRRHLCAHTSGLGVDRDGSYADFVSLPQTNVWHAHPDIPLETTAYFDPLGNATHTALQYQMVAEDVLITGAGPIGCMAVAICKHVGARHVVITDVNPYRLDLARKMGATLAVNPTEQTIADVQKELNMKEGFDIGLEMSGNPSAFNDMLDNMCHGGKISMLGILPTGTGIDWNKVIFNMLTVKGVYGREMYETWYLMTNMLLSGLDVSPVLTHQFKIEDYQEAFETMAAGNSGKIVLDWEE